MDKIEKIKKRFFRQTIENPDGDIVHHGDCLFFSHHICTCGLLHDLMTTRNPDDIYEKFYEEIEKQNNKL